MFRVVAHVLVMAAVIGVSVKWVLIKVGAPAWSYYLVLPPLAVACHITNCLLIRYFIKKRAPDLASDEKVFGDTRMWELTAGWGIVPKWVSWIGLMSFACLLAMLMPLIVSLFHR